MSVPMSQFFFSSAFYQIFWGEDYFEIQTHDLKVVDLDGLVRTAAGAEPLHVVGRVDLHCTLLHSAIDAHAVVDIVDLHTHTHTHSQHTRFQTGM